jgi:hypothetical protein
MNTKESNASPARRIEREVERERHERLLNDDARTGLSPADDYRIKDARESTSSTNLKRSPGR